LQKTISGVTKGRLLRQKYFHCVTKGLTPWQKVIPGVIEGALLTREGISDITEGVLLWQQDMHIV
jgi:hypothetical protein